MGLSLIIEKPLETNGERLVDTQIQAETGQVQSFSRPIRDTSSSAAVRPGSPWGLQLEQVWRGSAARLCLSSVLGALCSPFEGAMGTFLRQILNWQCQHVFPRDPHWWEEGIGPFKSWQYSKVISSTGIL